MDILAPRGFFLYMDWHRIDAWHHVDLGHLYILASNGYFGGMWIFLILTDIWHYMDIFLAAHGYFGSTWIFFF